MTNAKRNNKEIKDAIEKQMAEIIEKVLNDVAQEIVDNVISEYSTLDDSLGKHEARKELEHYAKGEIKAHIIGSGMGALIGEYGRGSKAAGRDENPNYDEWINSIYYNPFREAENNAILTRPKKSVRKLTWIEKNPYYLDIDDVPHRIRTGKLVNIEGKPLKKDGSHPYDAIKPQWIIKNLVKENLNWLVNRVCESMATEVAFAMLFDDITIKLKIEC